MQGSITLQFIQIWLFETSLLAIIASDTGELIGIWIDMISTDDAYTHGHGYSAHNVHAYTHTKYATQTCIHTIHMYRGTHYYVFI